MSQDTSTEQLTTLLAPVVEQAGMYLEEIELRGTGATRVLQVLVDLPEDTTEGVDMEDIARVSVAISEALDQHDAVDGPAYELEVSSPGAARELKQLRHWKRCVGRHVAVTPVNTTAGGKFVAQLLAVEPGTDLESTSVTLQRSEQVKKGMPVKVLEPEIWPLSAVRRAKVDVQG